MSVADFNINDLSSSDSPMSDIYRSSRPISVKVTDHNYNHVNPSPVKIQRDADLLEEFLSPRKLQALTGVDDLETVEYLEMRVNTEQMSLGNFGMYLPNLSQIKLSGSFIPSIRDLGTSLWSLQVLWMPQCSLQCMDGLVTMSNLKELYLAYNQIEDISSCGMLENLEILDLEGNMISDLTNIHYLSMCPALCRLTLEGNPLCNPDNYIAPQTYRRSVLEIVTQLQFLDDLASNFEMKMAEGDVSSEPIELRDTSNATLEFEDHWKFINSVLVESGLLAESDKCKHTEGRVDLSPEDSGRPSSSSYVNSSRPSTSLRPFSGQRPPLTSGMVRPMSSSTANQRLDSASTVDSGNDVDERPEDSELTAGRVVCGSITKSLRMKSADHVATDSPRLSNKDVLLSKNPTTRRNSNPTSHDHSVDRSCDLVLKELDEWRLDYERSKTRIEKQRAPQVLTIDYSEDEIVEVDLPNKPDKPNTETAKPARKVKEKPEIKLNPIRNGKVVSAKLPSSWVPKDQQLKTTAGGAGAPVIVQSAPPMSRIRRQLLESGVSTMTPSRPVLKK